MSQFKKFPLLIGISGCSCSGKTTLSQQLKDDLTNEFDVHLIGQDQFYLTDSQIPKDNDTGYDNWDTPEAINMNQFYNSIVDLKQKFTPTNSSMKPSIIIVEGDYEVLLNRRNSRVGYETIEGFWKDPDNYFELIAYPSYLAYYQSIHDLIQVDSNPKGDTTIQYNNFNMYCLNTGVLNEQQALLLTKLWIFNK